MSDKILDFNLHTRGKGDVFMCKILKSIQGKTASDILEKYHISLNPPINLSALLKSIGISTKAYDFSEIESAVGYELGEILGVTISKGDNLTIFYRKDDTENKQRFTIAHELAHCCLHSEKSRHSHVNVRKNEDDKSRTEERADIFAGELLIPKEPLIKIYNEMLVPSLSSLSKIFGVSTCVMAARLDYLSLPYLKDAEYTYS